VATGAFLLALREGCSDRQAEQRRRELQQLVEDAELALSELLAQTDKPAASAARALLEQVARQDVEPDGKGGVEIREGVAKDRVISTVDPEMRHGHKSSAGRWDGWKKHVSVEPQTELITAVEVSAANVNDGAMAMKLLEHQAEVVPTTRSGQHGDGAHEQAGSQRRCEIEHASTQSGGDGGAHRPGGWCSTHRSVERRVSP
jgi:hypothetical protein